MSWRSGKSIKLRYPIRLSFGEQNNSQDINRVLGNIKENIKFIGTENPRFYEWKQHKRGFMKTIHDF